MFESTSVCTQDSRRHYIYVNCMRMSLAVKAIDVFDRKSDYLAVGSFV